MFIDTILHLYFIFCNSFASRLSFVLTIYKITSHLIDARGRANVSRGRCVHLFVNSDFEQLIILERLGAEHQTVIVLGGVARGRAVVVAEGDTMSASPVEHVERRSPLIPHTDCDRSTYHNTPRRRRTRRITALRPPPPSYTRDCGF